MGLIPQSLYRTISVLLVLLFTGTWLASGAFAQTESTVDTNARVLRNEGADTHVDNVTELNSAFDDAAPIILPDESTLYFSSNRTDGKFSIWVSHRLSKTAWGAPEKFAELPGKENISGFTLSSDQTHAIMSCCNRPDGILGSCDLYEGDIADGKLTNIHSLGKTINSEWWEGQPSLSQDGQLLFFASDRKHGQGGTDIYMSAKTSSGTWGEPVDLSFNTGGNEMSPMISSDNETLYFAADGLPGGMGGFDIYVTHRTGTNSWSIPKNLGPAVNSKKDDLFFAVPPSEDAVYLASNRDGGSGGFDMYRVSPNPVKPVARIITMHGNVLDAETGRLVRTNPDVQLSLSSNSEVLQNLGQGAAYSAVVPLGALVRIKATADNYVAGSIEVQAPSELNPSGFSQDIKLTPSKAQVEGHVSNAFSHKAIQTKLTLEELASDGVGVKSTASVETLADGAYKFDLLPGSKYRLSTSVQDYKPYTVTIDGPTTHEANEKIEKEVYLTPSDIKAVIVYFETAKSDLKTEEAPKLEHFIEQVKQNPNVRIEIQGHTDSIGSAEANQALSEARAASVQNYLLSRGVPTGQLALVRGFGMAEPIAPNLTEAERAKNRRVEVRIVGIQ